MIDQIFEGFSIFVWINSDDENEDYQTTQAVLLRTCDRFTYYDELQSNRFRTFDDFLHKLRMLEIPFYDLSNNLDVYKSGYTSEGEES